MKGGIKMKQKIIIILALILIGSAHAAIKPNVIV